MSEPQIILTTSMFQAITTILTACGNADLSKEEGDDVLHFVRDAMSRAAQCLTADDLAEVRPGTEDKACAIRGLNLFIEEQLERVMSHRRAAETRERFNQEMKMRSANHIRATS